MSEDTEFEVEVEPTDSIVSTKSEIKPSSMSSYRGIHTKKQLAELGLAFLPVTYLGNKDDKVAQERFQRASTGEDIGEAISILSKGVQTDTNFGLAFYGACKWASFNFPLVSIGHKQAASFSATYPNPEVIGEINLPWDSFVLDIPSKVFSFVSESGETHEVSFILVMKHSMIKDNRVGYYYAAFTNSKEGSFLWRSASSVSKFLDLDKEEVEKAVDSCKDPKIKINSEEDLAKFMESDLALPLDAFTSSMTTQEVRLGLMIGRLVANVCIAMSDPSKRLLAGSRKSKKSNRKAKKSKPRSLKEVLLRTDFLTYKITTPVTVDCRDAIQSYIKSGAKEVKVRTLVRGSWRNQPHGPSSKLRKLIWVEPYWSPKLKDDHDLPLAVRSHKLKGSTQSA